MTGSLAFEAEPRNLENAAAGGTRSLEYTRFREGNLMSRFFEFPRNTSALTLTAAVPGRIQLIVDCGDETVLENLSVEYRRVLRPTRLSRTLSIPCGNGR
jgi:hypothetical protein